jgi:hypothetical protein
MRYAHMASKFLTTPTITKARPCLSAVTATSRGTRADPGTSTLDGLAYTTAAPRGIWVLLFLLTAGFTAGYAMLYTAMPIMVTEAGAGTAAGHRHWHARRRRRAGNLDRTRDLDRAAE